MSQGPLHKQTTKHKVIGHSADSIMERDLKNLVSACDARMNLDLADSEEAKTQSLSGSHLPLSHQMRSSKRGGPWIVVVGISQYERQFAQ